MVGAVKATEAEPFPPDTWVIVGAFGRFRRTGMTGSTMVPFATPSASPSPPSVRWRVIVSPEIVAIDERSTYEPFWYLKTAVGSLPGGNCNVTSILAPGVSPLTVYDSDPVRTVAPEGNVLFAIGVVDTFETVVPVGEDT
jgi:hypothetical protein